MVIQIMKDPRIKDFVYLQSEKKPVYPKCPPDGRFREKAKRKSNLYIYKKLRNI